MGHWAGFEEKEYEVLSNVSLSLISASQPKNVNPPPIFSPGQVLESLLGFDFSIYLEPTSNAFRLLFGKYVGPRTPLRLPPPALPPQTSVVNTFVQYKRPEIFTSKHRQKVWKGEEFLRFKVKSEYRRNNTTIEDHSQLEALTSLAQHPGKTVVRYACPTVWTKEDLYTHYANNTLLKSSTFVDPRQLILTRNPVTWHDYWTFKPSKPLHGRPNPSQDEEDTEDGDGFMEEISSEIDKSASPAGDSFSQFDEIRSITRTSVNQLSFFSSQSERRSLTRAEAIARESDLTVDDFLDSPWREQDPEIPVGESANRQARAPEGDELDPIRTVLEIAATASQLGTTWLVSPKLP